jgi:hypothetical protein
MSGSSSRLALLAQRAQGGDSASRQEFKENLETALVHIVSWTLQSGGRHNSLSRHILAEARRLAPTADLARAWRSLSGPVAERVCAGILANLSPLAPFPENSLDTVCN